MTSGEVLQAWRAARGSQERGAEAVVLDLQAEGEVGEALAQVAVVALVGPEGRA